MTNHTLFAVAPYVALASFAGVTALRYVLTGRRLSNESLATALRLFAGNRAWRAGLLGVLASHGLILLLPRLFLSWNQDLTRLVAAEALFCGAGLLTAVGLVSLLRAHLGDPVLRRESSVADAILLGLLLVQVVSGMSVTVLYRWASAWSPVTLTPYVRSVVALRPTVPLVETMPYLVRLHTFSAIALLSILPFTHVIDLVLVPVHQAFGLAFRPLQRAARRAWQIVEQRARVNFAAFGWREDEDEGF